MRYALKLKNLTFYVKVWGYNVKLKVLMFYVEVWRGLVKLKILTFYVKFVRYAYVGVCACARRCACVSICVWTYAIKLKTLTLYVGSWRCGLKLGILLFFLELGGFQLEHLDVLCGGAI